MNLPEVFFDVGMWIYPDFVVIGLLTMAFTLMILFASRTWSSLGFAVVLATSYVLAQWVGWPFTLLIIIEAGVLGALLLRTLYSIIRRGI